MLPESKAKPGFVPGQPIAHGIQRKIYRDLAAQIFTKRHRKRLQTSPLLTLGVIGSAEAALAIESRGTLSMSAPGRSRTDTGDPFRGPASSLGLRGRIHNTARVIA